MDLLLSFSSFILIALLALFVIKAGSHLHKHEYKYYIVAAVIATVATVFSVLAQFDVIDVTTPVIYQVFFQGHLTLAFFTLVMFAGAFAKKTKPKITLMKVRRELAILGFITLIPHAVLLLITALSALNPTGTLAFLIMLPLFITSFTKIRKKMHPLQWRKLHKWAYAAYAMIFLHLASITIIAQRGGDRAYDDYWLLRLFMYLIIFGVYTVLKFKNYILVQDKKPQPKKQA